MAKRESREQTKARVARIARTLAGLYPQARIMAAELRWDRAREEAEVAGFVGDLRRRRAA